ncbi:hypothetical protein EDF56_10162 [Novosphingobium sp. PhB165]|uniref:hypothetical protein n=1 Tax=Novosphingobium sp. PhB165 TaxID=2485105 RepID=UPI00104D8059|nr:hypothetical protein [Novosphingobium sp. PhB165]TCM21398.1 hypothetical protein EDF56_10162 [Novosphingobium sp. PhB165]
MAPATAFGRIVAPLVDTLVDDQCAATREHERVMVQDYVLATVAAMPDFFRLGFHLLAYLFEYAPILHGEARFSHLVPARRKAHVARWRGSAIAPLRSMIAFYASFSAYGLYSVAYPAGQDERGRIAA